MVNIEDKIPSRNIDKNKPLKIYHGKIAYLENTTYDFLDCHDTHPSLFNSEYKEVKSIGLCFKGESYPLSELGKSVSPSHEFSLQKKEFEELKKRLGVSKNEEMIGKKITGVYEKYKDFCRYLSQEKDYFSFKFVFAPSKNKIIKKLIFNTRGLFGNFHD